MQYVWQHRLWPAGALRSVDGERIDVLDPGLLNTGSGPDFFNAKLTIGGEKWAGNVELHVRASDWYRHGHHNDRAYDSVVLHVVGSDDTRIARPDGSPVPQMVLDCAPDFRRHYDELTCRLSNAPACIDRLATIPAVHITSWLTALAMERLYRKADHIAQLAARFEGDWSAAIFVVLARALGFSVNAEPFERTAMSVPLKILLKHLDSLETVEAILMGQAGFLDTNPTADPYIERLRGHYTFMRAKFGLVQPQNLGWKTGAIRPQNSPYRRMALLAALVAAGFRPGYHIFNVGSAGEAADLFRAPLSPYWQSHHAPGCATASRQPAVLSRASLDTLVINVVVPAMTAYARAYARPELHTRATDILASLPPENNSVVRTFTAAGVPCPDALGSQAMVELQRNYCDPRKCLYCRIGHRLLAEKAIKTPSTI